MLQVVVCGAAGRMGRENIAVCSADKEVNVAGAVEMHDSPHTGEDAGSVAGIGNIGIRITDSLESVIEKADAVIDFTNPSSTMQNLEIAQKYKKAIVIGTTGFTQEQYNKIRSFARNIPVVLSPNMSQGVNVLFYLVKKAALLLGDQFEVEIAEVHHNQKKDAPSGTALQLGRIIADVRGQKLEEVGVLGRHGNTGQRRRSEIGISSLRLSDVVGDHCVMFGGSGERIELAHKTSSRSIYASGALRAVKFLSRKKRGFFSMNDVLGIE
jgi:4-hydroxy-tetrahydrodipicolinate reductase